jgi:maltose phosphorylase
MMVNNNCYTNVMGKKMFNYTVDVLEEMKREAPELYRAAVKKTELKPGEPAEWKRMADHMRIPKDEATGIYEQFDGYFDLPHVDVANFPASDIPVYKNWAYIRIFRHNMIKQPDFLNLPFYYSSDYTMEEKRANYEFYEARTIHESSLSPSLHGILATELGKLDDAYDFLAYAARLDMDNYNHNTDQGIHATASAGVWAGMVQGFGGMRTDGDRLSFAPSIPVKWNSYAFRVLYKGALIEVNVDKSTASFKVIEGPDVTVDVYGNAEKITAGKKSARFGASN